MNAPVHAPITHKSKPTAASTYGRWNPDADGLQRIVSTVPGRRLSTARDDMLPNASLQYDGARAASHQSVDAEKEAALVPRLGHEFRRVRVNADLDERRYRQTNLSPSGPARVRTTIEHHRHRLSANIRREDSGRSGFQSVSGAALSTSYPDAPAGHEQTSSIAFETLLGQTRQAPVGAVREPRGGETVRLPDITMAPSEALEQTDAIASTLTYNSSVTKSGAAPDGFGVTLPYTHAISGINVTAAAGSFNVTATVDNPITFQVRSSTGPDGQVDIASETDSDITAGNYATVVADLTPDMSDLNGRPPRTQFWAEDICTRHERFHADEDVVHGRAGVAAAQTWLNGQTAGSVADVNTLLGQVPARVAATVSTAMAYPGREERSYGNGAPLYRARVNAIRGRGSGGGYAGLSRGAKAAIGIVGGAVVGAGIGALVGGPVGAAVGAGVGALAGGLGSLLF
jgi:hypothetical protein